MCKLLRSVQRFPKLVKGVKTFVTPPKSCNVKIIIPSKKLNNGEKIPVIGLGTWGSVQEEVVGAVKAAIDVGYRMIDTAFVYQNEKFVGQAIQEKIKDKKIKREDLFITSKLWNTYHPADLVGQAFRMSLNALQMTYMDLYLMHWPTAYAEGNILFPRDACGRIKFSHVDYIETWKAMEELQKKGLVKSIGLSNFNKAQIDRLLKTASIPPAILQCECHPFLNQKKLIKYCKSKNIAFMAYSSLGSSPTRPYAVKGEERIMDCKEITRIAHSHQKTPAQVLLRYQLQRGNMVIPKSTIRSEIEENFQVFGWKLTNEQMAELDSMDINYRYVNKIGEAGKHKHYPFWDEY